MHVFNDASAIDRIDTMISIIERWLYVQLSMTITIPSPYVISISYLETFVPEERAGSRYATEMKKRIEYLCLLYDGGIPFKSLFPYHFLPIFFYNWAEYRCSLLICLVFIVIQAIFTYFSFFLLPNMYM